MDAATGQSLREAVANGAMPPLLPLFLLLLTGLYMFFLPYAARRRTGANDGSLS